MPRDWSGVSLHVHIHQPREGREWTWNVVRSAWAVGSAGLSSQVLEGEVVLAPDVPLRSALVEVLDAVAAAVVES